MNFYRLFEILTARSQVNDAVGVRVYFAEQECELHREQPLTLMPAFRF